MRGPWPCPAAQAWVCSRNRGSLRGLPVPEAVTCGAAAPAERGGPREPALGVHRPAPRACSRSSHSELTTLGPPASGEPFGTAAGRSQRGSWQRPAVLCRGGSAHLPEQSAEPEAPGSSTPAPEGALPCRGRTDGLTDGWTGRRPPGRGETGRTVGLRAGLRGRTVLRVRAAMNAPGHLSMRTRAGTRPSSPERAPKSHAFLPQPAFSPRWAQ